MKSEKIGVDQFLPIWVVRAVHVQNQMREVFICKTWNDGGKDIACPINRPRVCARSQPHTLREVWKWSLLAEKGVAASVVRVWSRHIPEAVRTVLSEKYIDPKVQFIVHHASYKRHGVIGKLL